MGRAQFDIGELAFVTNAVASYKQLAYTFTQLVGGDESGPLREFWNKKIVRREEKTWMTESEAREWDEFTLHIFPQTWGSTSCGWGGMGGAMMTTSYTTIIESRFGFACVFYAGQLVYICEMDDAYKEYQQKSYRGLPGLYECRDKLTIIYSKKR
jgi:hypothetical protein